MTDPKEEREFDNINAMSRLELCKLWRHAPPGHPYFDNQRPYYKVFKARLDDLGGFSQAISKLIAWCPSGAMEA